MWILRNLPLLQRGLVRKIGGEQTVKLQLLRYPREKEGTYKKKCSRGVELKKGFLEQDKRSFRGEPSRRRDVQEGAKDWMQDYGGGGGVLWGGLLGWGVGGGGVGGGGGLGGGGFGGVWGVWGLFWEVIVSSRGLLVGGGGGGGKARNTDSGEKVAPGSESPTGEKGTGLEVRETKGRGGYEVSSEKSAQGGLKSKKRKKRC